QARLPDMFLVVVGKHVARMRVDAPASEFVNCSVLLVEPQGNDAQRPIDIQPGRTGRCRKPPANTANPMPYHPTIRA
ncbi:MAG TPA: hypothetical protein VK442_00630, partial [Xanthobacteraceae bacterium]|nr:hypothetical protein [Xanthobacteraceae bacterium]